jgi:hypothetical protein
LRRTLAELPESLDETYERIVKDIKKGNGADAYRMLQCLVVAIRPLSVAELAELLAFDFDASATKGGIPKLNSKWRWEDHEQAVLSTCSSLITIVPGRSHVVQFSHFSVKEFLLSDRLASSTKGISQYHILLEEANTLIAKACLGVLLRDSVDDSSAGTAPLALYAAEHWVAHATVQNVTSRIRNGIESLFDPERPYFSAWVKLHNADYRKWGSSLESKMQPEAAPLYHAASYGFHEIVERLALKRPLYINAVSGYAGTALHAASAAGHVEVVRSLLKHGVVVDALGVLNTSPLQLASFKGHLSVVECLLDHGADVNFQDDYRRTPLSLAEGGGYVEIVRVLLERGADANFRCKDGLTAIHKACFYGYPKDAPLVRLGPEHHADRNARDEKRQTASSLPGYSSDRVSLRSHRSR